MLTLVFFVNMRYFFFHFCTKRGEIVTYCDVFDTLMCFPSETSRNLLEGVFYSDLWLFVSVNDSFSNAKTMFQCCESIALVHAEDCFLACRALPTFCKLSCFVQ